MNQQPASLKDTLQKAIEQLQKVRRYSVVLFIIFVAILYGWLVLRVNDLTNTQPSSEAVNSQVQAARIPKIDPHVIQQLQSLQDNSVSVQTLFNSLRQNPFQ